MDNPFGADPIQNDDDPFGAEPEDDDEDNPFAMSSHQKQTAPSHTSLMEREKKLQRKEQDLQRREAELARQERTVGGQQAKESANFPSFWPLVYIDIAHDIPKDQQSIMRTLFALYLIVVLGFVWNAICCLVLVMEDHCKFAIGDFIMSAAYAVFGIPGAWHFWFKRAYCAVREDSSMAFVLFFISMACHIMFSAQIAIGVPWTSSAGFLPAMKSKGGDMAICGICCILWTLITGTSVWTWRQMHFEYTIRGIDGLETIKAAAARRFGAAAAASLTLKKADDGAGHYSQTSTAEA